MASFERRGDSWRVQVKRDGVRDSATFPTKAQAKAWAIYREAELADKKHGRIPNKTFGDLLQKYADEVSPTKRGSRWEIVRIAKIIAEDELADVKLSALGKTDIAEWRDRRMTAVSAASVRREWNLLSSACSVAINEWGWIHDHPMKSVKRPAPGRHRDRRITQAEIDAICAKLGMDWEKKPVLCKQRTAFVMLFAIETAMRIGEICSLEWGDVHKTKRFVQLHMTKNGSDRKVPLSSSAVRILDRMDGIHSESVFHVSSGTADVAFRKARTLAGIDNLHFHDTRHEAITRLARKLDVLDLARMTGHKDISMLMIYYNATPAELACRLD